MGARWNLNSRVPGSVADLRAHLEAERVAYLRTNFERPDEPLTVAQRADYAAQAAVVGPEMARAIEAAVKLAEGHGTGPFHASLSAYGYEDGRRCISVSVERAEAM